MIRNLTHRADVDDLCRELKDMLPVRIQFDKARPTTGTDAERWSRANARFHGGIVAELSRITGWRVDEAKEILLKTFALLRQYKDDNGNNVYEVESVSGMNLDRLLRLNLECDQFIQENWGIVPEDPMEVKTKTLK